MSSDRTHAVVMGGSIAGLAAARVLADHYRHVTVIERDEVDGGARRGTPQARHLHTLLPAGKQALESLFPGIGREYVAAGAPSGDISQVQLTFSGHRLMTGHVGLEVLEASRPFLESGIRRRVRTLSNVAVRTGCTVTGPIVEAGRIRGVETDTGSIPSDLVVDATGRGSPTPAWLRSLGYREPREDRVRVNVVYVSGRFTLPDDAFDGFIDVVIAADPDVPRGAAVQRQEDGAWLVTLNGYLGNRPPTDPDGWLAYAATLRDPSIAATLKRGRLLGPLVQHGFPHSQRRRYERLRRMPDGLIVMGDAMCSFNPVYGQGMTVALMEAVALGQILAAFDGEPGRRFHRRASRIVDVPWEISAGGDLRFPDVPGRRSAKVRLLNRYVERIHAAGTHDPRVAIQFLRVIALLDPPAALLHPTMVRRVFARAKPSPGIADAAVSVSSRP